MNFGPYFDIWTWDTERCFMAFLESSLKGTDGL